MPYSITIYGRFEEGKGDALCIDEFNEIYSAGGQTALTRHFPEDYPNPSELAGKGERRTGSEDTGSVKTEQDGGGSPESTESVKKFSKEAILRAENAV